MHRPAAHRVATLLTVSALVALLAQPAHAIEDRADTERNEAPRDDRKLAWKLTAGRYLETDGRPAWDVNLRANTQTDTFWIGQYRRSDEFSQARAGYEHQFALPFGRLIGSVQVASGGFVGGSATLELSAGEASPVRGLLGIGRTNLKPYYNLNFDPNDSLLVGVGGKIGYGIEASLYQIRDNRLDTGQRVTHLVLRAPLGAGQRLTLDVSRRQGRAEADAEFFEGTGVSVAYDRDPWFVRVAHDPKAGFTASDMTRMSVGFRF